MIIFQKGDNTKIQNYRPVSNHPQFLKLFSWIICLGELRNACAASGQSFNQTCIHPTPVQTQKIFLVHLLLPTKLPAPDKSPPIRPYLREKITGPENFTIFPDPPFTRARKGRLSNKRLINEGIWTEYSNSSNTTTLWYLQFRSWKVSEQGEKFHQEFNALSKKIESTNVNWLLGPTKCVLKAWYSRKSQLFIVQ